MTTPLRDKIAGHRFLAYIDTRRIGEGDEYTGTPMCVCGWEGDDWAEHVADTILNDPTLAVIDTPPGASERDGRGMRWQTGHEGRQEVVLWPDNTITANGALYWNPTQGDDPTLFVAAIIAAYRHAQDTK